MKMLAYPEFVLNDLVYKSTEEILLNFYIVIIKKSIAI